MKNPNCVNMTKNGRGRHVPLSQAAMDIIGQLPKYNDVPFSQIDGEPLMPWDVSKTHPYLADMWQCRAGEVAARIKGKLKVILALKVCTVGHGVRLAALCGAGVVMTRN